MSDAPRFGRYAEIPVDRMTPEQQEGYRFLVDGPRGRLPGPYKVWVHNPKLVHAAAPLGQHFTPGQSSLSEREREIAVLVMTSRWHSAYPTAAHEKRGKEVDLPTAAVEAIIAGLPTSFPDAREQVTYEVAMALVGGRLVPQGLYDRAVTVLGHETVTDVIVLMGYYTAVALTMNFYAVPAGSPGLARRADVGRPRRRPDATRTCSVGATASFPERRAPRWCGSPRRRCRARRRTRR
jgi:4-carboxymuconolactone decarboxylase